MIRYLRHLVHILQEDVIRLADDRRALHGSRRSLAVEGPEAHLLGSPFGYESEETDVTTWLTYRRFLRDKPGFGESPTVYAEATRLVELALTTGSCGVINFGVCYAHLDSQLARRHPHATFVGIERSELVQTLNRSEFRSLPNLKFMSGDIFELLEPMTLTNYVMLHTRTLTLLGPRFVNALYEFASAKGIRWIVGVEPYGVSRESGECPSLTYEARESVPFRGPMYLHNYPEMLGRHGYRLLEATMARTAHSHPDYRLFCYLASLSLDPNTT